MGACFDAFPRTPLRDGFEMSATGSTGQFRRTHGQSPRVLKVGIASDAFRLGHVDGAWRIAERQWFRVRDVVTVRIRGPVAGDAVVTCVIPGHEQKGEELVADELRLDESPPLAFELSGNCGYAAPFEYVSAP